jgi:hypothetical protein
MLNFSPGLRRMLMKFQGEVLVTVERSEPLG